MRTMATGQAEETLQLEVSERSNPSTFLDWEIGLREPACHQEGVKWEKKWRLCGFAHQP
jgi:hypothetical protein